MISGVFALISSMSSVRRIFFTFVPFLRDIFVHFTSSCCVSWTVSPEVSSFPKASTVTVDSDIGSIGYGYSYLYFFS